MVVQPREQSASPALYQLVFASLQVRTGFHDSPLADSDVQTSPEHLDIREEQVGTLHIRCGHGTSRDVCA
ncbi:hypothetical protein, partial [Intrasporangium sp.]|uniref:hypothetical protein n=1 Tax=Intrasporangium sp. TaxID=1925024 RepID=UPI003365A788